MEHLNAVGFDNLFLPGGLAGNAAIGGAALAAMLLLYGICLRFKTPLLGAMTGAAVGGYFNFIMCFATIAISASVVSLSQVREWSSTVYPAW